MNPIERIEAALKERYNVRELPRQMAAAVDAAKNGSLSALESMLDGRELYRWAGDVQAALTEARNALTAVVEAPFDLASLTISELRDLAAERGVAIPAGPKAAIVDALNAEPESLDEDGDNAPPPASEEDDTSPVEPPTA